MAPSGEAYNVDWVVSNTSNVHVANNRDWFTSYTPFKTELGSIYHKNVSEVFGIGDVELKVKLYPTKRRCKPNFGTLVLRNVLHVPTYVCNVFAEMAASPEYEAILSVGVFHGVIRGHLEDKDKKRAGLITMPRLPRLLLYGQCARKSSLNDGLYIINAEWSPEERARWNAREPAPATVLPGDDGSGYTAEEKAWLKQHYGGEYEFLRVYGLSIFNEEGREEGRSVARVMMGNAGEVQNGSKPEASNATSPRPGGITHCVISPICFKHELEDNDDGQQERKRRRF